MKPQEALEDSGLVIRAREGDMEAFESIVRKYQREVYALCRRVAGTHQAADDLAQETFIRAYLNLASFDTAFPLYPWLRTIAMNASLNYLKARRREVPLPEGDRPPAHPPSASPDDPTLDEIERSEFDDRFGRALEDLPPEQRRVFVLRFYENMSYDEIARALDLAAGTVMSRLNRARRRLKLLLADTLLRRA